MRTARTDLLVGMADQGVSSLTNLVAVFAIASSVGVDEFGVFSLCYAGLILLLAFSRAYFGLPISLEARDTTGASPSSYHAGISALLMISPLIVLGLGLFAGFSSHSAGALWLGLSVAAASPFFLAQDLARYQLIAERRSIWALASDCAWLAVVGTLWLVRSQIPIPVIALMWCTGPLAAFAVAIAARRPRITWREGLRAMTPKRGVREASTLTVLLSNGLTLVIGVLMLPVYGVGAAGVLRAASTAFGPLNALIAYLDTGVLAALARRSRNRDLGIVGVLAGAFTTLVLVWGTTLLCLPTPVGVYLLGETWLTARQILPITMIEFVFVGLSAAAALFLKVRGLARQLVSTKAAWTLTAFSGVLIAVVADTPFGAVPCSLAIGAMVGAALQWVLVWRESNRRRGASSWPNAQPRREQI